MQAILATSGNAIPALPAEPSPPAAVRRRRGDRRTRPRRRFRPRQQRRRRLPARSRPWWRRVATGRAGPLLLACGRDQGQALAGDLRARGFRVVRRVVYAAAPPGTLPETARDAFASGSLTAALFFSAETARHCVRLLRAARLHEAVRSVDALAIGRPAAVALQALPWRRIQRRRSAEPGRDARAAAMSELDRPSRRTRKPSRQRRRTVRAGAAASPVSLADRRRIPDPGSRADLGLAASRRSADRCPSRPTPWRGSSARWKRAWPDWSSARSRRSRTLARSAARVTALEQRPLPQGGSAAPRRPISPRWRGASPRWSSGNRRTLRRWSEPRRTGSAGRTTQADVSRGWHDRRPPHRTGECKPDHAGRRARRMDAVEGRLAASEKANRRVAAGAGRRSGPDRRPKARRPARRAAGARAVRRRRPAHRSRVAPGVSPGRARGAGGLPPGRAKASRC